MPRQRTGFLHTHVSFEWNTSFPLVYSDEIKSCQNTAGSLSSSLFTIFNSYSSQGTGLNICGGTGFA